MEHDADRVLLVRLDERMTAINTELAAMRLFLTERVMTREACQVRQMEHDRSRTYDRMESLAKICVMVSIAVGIFWAVLTKV